MAGNTTDKAKGSPTEALLYLAKKNSAGTINQGQAVYTVSRDDVIFLVELAKADADGTMPCLGLADEAITDTAEGNVAIRGIISGLNTSSYSVGDEVYVSETTAGAITLSRPTGTNRDRTEKIGVVTYAHATEGSVDLYGGGIAVDTSANVNGYTEKTAPVSADLLLIEDSAASNVKKKVQVGKLPPPSCYQASATGDITTTATEEVVATSMTLSPPVAEYLVSFSGSVDHGTNNASIYPSIYVGGTKVTHSERTFTRGGSQGDVSIPFHCQARLTVAVEQSIEGRWKVSGGTGTMHERSLIALRVVDPT